MTEITALRKKIASEVCRKPYQCKRYNSQRILKQIIAAGSRKLWGSNSCQNNIASVIPHF